MSLRLFARAFVTLSAIVFGSAALATGCADDEAIVGGSCASGFVQCGDRCVDLTSDPSHCGGCGNACPAGAGCVAGVCGATLIDGSSGDGSDLDASGDATVDGPLADGTAGTDSAAADGSNESGDGAALDGSNSSDATGDSTVGDATLLDATLADATLADATLADGAAPDGAEGSDAVADGTTSDAEAPDTSAFDGENGQSGDEGCPPGLMTCGNQCVDLTQDSANCGVCGNVCASQICQNSQCVGATTGGIVFIGHDFATTTPGTTQARVLSNAVFIPQTNPLRVLSYERYAEASAVTRIMTILNGVAKELGRTLNITETTVDADIPNTLSLQNFDVLLVPDQPSAPAGALAALGPPTGGNWAAALASFAQNGGVVVVLDGGTGVGEMPAFVTGTGLLAISAQAPVAAGTLVQDVARADVEGVGLVSPYATAGNSVSVTTEAQGGDVVYVVIISSDASPGPPVVVHKVF